MFKEKFKKSVRFKFLVVMSVILFISTVVLSSVIAVNERKMLMYSLLTKGQSFASYIAKLSIDPLIMKDSIQLDSFVNEANKDEDVMFIIIKDADGNIMTSQYASINYQSLMLKTILPKISKDSDLSDIIAAVKEKEAVTELSAPVQSGIHTIGKVTIGMSGHRINQQILNTILFVIALNLVVALVLGVVLFSASKKIILDPIRELAEAAFYLAKGDLSTQVKIKTTGEVQTLVDSFNRMAEDLNKTTVSKDYVDNIIKSMIDTLIVLSPDSKILRANEAACALLGYDEEYLKGKSFEMICENGLSEDGGSIDSILERGHIRDVEKIYLARNRIKIPMLFAASALRDADGNIQGIVCVAQDITERRRLEEQLFQAQKMELIGQLAGGIAHDFNNILSAIMGYSNIIQMKMDKNEPLRAYVDNIVSASEKAANLTKSLLAFSRKQIINPKPVKLNDIVKNVEKLLLRIIGEDIELNTKLSAEDPVVMADSGQIEQVLMNFAANARDAMPDGGLLIIENELVEIDEEFIQTHSYVLPGKYALMSVTDTGIGMDEKIKEKIFEPFFTTKETGRGTGLGLSMAYGIIKQHKGLVNCYSEVGKGTTFRIYLPVIEATGEEEKPVQPVGTPVCGSETILLAEDDASLRKLTRDVLEKFGYTIITAENGEDAVNIFMDNKDKIQLLLFDLIMPRKNGKEAYEEIKKINPYIKTLFLSGYTANLVHKKGILEEGINFILKPVSINTLLLKVRETLDS
jgi:PAS domain S-box-containing protein